MIKFYVLLFAIFWGITACQKVEKAGIILHPRQQFEKYLKVGDSIYAKKKGLQSFEESMVYFDSAMVVAQHQNDTFMLAEGIFAKARVYDAWNRQPQKTIQLLTEAADLYAAAFDSTTREYYIRHLIAHTYAKMGDSTACVQTLEAIHDTITTQSPAIRKKMNYISKMANISCEVRNYDLAERILKNLTQRAWIKNNSNSYNYEDYYFMTRTAIDVYKYKNYATPYLDSVELALRHVKSSMDSLIYLDILAKFAAETRQYDKAYSFLKKHENLSYKTITQAGIGSMENRLLNLELQVQKRKVETERIISRSRNILLLVLIFAIAIICVVLVRSHREYLTSTAQALQLQHLNTALQSKVEEVKLVNKEVQHRIKNNLHLIFSLLNMQERKSENPDTIENLQKARLRIESIAGLHDLLGQNNNELDFSTYINNLVETIINCIETDHKVITNLSVQQIELPQRYFFSLGLILNEWITNSIKYAETKSPLVLTIKITQEEGEVAVEYYDNGKVITNDDAPSGLGKEIINLLVRQMRAKLRHNTNNLYHLYLKIKNE